MDKRKRGIVAVLLLFAGLVMFQVVSPGPTTMPPAVTLPDGSTVRLEQVTYGREHFRPGKWWYSYVHRLPNSWQSWVERHSSPGMTTTELSLGVWLVSDRNMNQSDAWLDFQHAALVDEQGVELPVVGRRDFSSYSSTELPMLGWNFTTFPRRGSVMTARFYDRKPDGELVLTASFQFPNPVRDKFPVWQPQPLPAVVTNGDLQIELMEFRVRAGKRDFLRASNWDEPGKAWASFRWTQQGGASDRWDIDGIEMSDATGNITQDFGGMGQRFNNGSVLIFGWPNLWPSETAWKMRVNSLRNGKATFTGHELIVVSDLVVPSNNAATPTNLVSNRLGHAVRVLGLLNGNAQFSDRPSRRGNEGVRLEVDVFPELTEKRLTFVRAIDSHGREVGLDGWGWDRRSFSFGFKPEPDAQSLSFTLAVQEVVAAEFLVKPEVFKPPLETPKGPTK